MFRRQPTSSEETALREALQALKEAEKSYEATTKEKRKLLDEARKQYDAAVEGAEAGVEQAIAAYDGAVAAADAQRVEAEAFGQRLLGQVGPVRLFEDRLEAPEGTAKLSPQVKAAVDNSGNKSVSVTQQQRLTVTRMAVMGPFSLAAPKKKKKQVHVTDSRTLFLTIEAPEFTSVTKCNPDGEPGVRQFAATLANAGRNAAAVKAERDERIRAANHHREAVEQDRSAIEAAEATLDATRKDTAQIDSMRSTLVETLNSEDVIDSRRTVQQREVELVLATSVVDGQEPEVESELQQQESEEPGP